MTNYIFVVCVFRIALPILIATCVVFRPSGLSFIYLLLLFLLPLIHVPTYTSMKRQTGLFLKLLLVISFLTTLLQFAFQVVLLAMPPYGHILLDCKMLEKILRHVGFVRLNKISPISAITWLSPEILMLTTSIVVFLLTRSLIREKLTTIVSEEGHSYIKKRKPKTKEYSLFVTFGKYSVLIMLCLAAVLRPSVQGGFYFLIFLSISTWWACYKQLQKKFAILLRFLMVIVFIHLICLYLYQFQYLQDMLDKNSIYARYFALTPIFSVDCSKDPRDFIWSHDEWATYANPIALYILYYILALESRALMKPQSKKKQGPFSRLEGSFTGTLGRQMSQRLSSRRLMRSGTTKNRWQSATRKVREKARERPTPGEKTPLMRGVSPSKKYTSSNAGTKKSNILQDSTGSVIITEEGPNDIQMDILALSEDDYKPTLFDNIMYIIENLLQIIIKSSYIATNIIMMAWSITYLSWITFVLLLWANLLWLVPNQRKSMLRSSPFLVIYAWFLLITAYIYSMNLTESELPSTIKGVNLAQIGFQKILVLPCNPLIIKCLFTTMFWITLRQYMQERITERQSSTLADMVAPLQVTFGATGISSEQERGNKIIEKIGDIIKNLATKFWIWVVASTLFAVAITGQRMTAFRILYMALFLFFILTFQLSFQLWRKMMLGFWLTVIVYSMINLVAVYTYQFDNFPEYWRDYLYIPIQQQLDIGLERFETKQLFVRLVTPTFFVIITVIQLHYFHKDFMKLSDPKNTNILGVDLDASSLQGAKRFSNSEKDDPTTSSFRLDLNDTEMSFTLITNQWIKKIQYFIDIFFLFMEVHMPKIVLFIAMLMCINDSCAILFLIVLLIIMGFTFGRPIQIFSIYSSSIFVSLLLLARMVYQIQYIDANNWNVTCENRNSTNHDNNAQWLGFYKTDKDTSLGYIVRWNITYILFVTLWSVILVRQFYYKLSKNKPVSRVFFIFPKITRSDADKNLKNCIKYLLNYGYYKLGVEISLIATVALIGFRMDIYSVIYAIWLCILFPLKRTSISYIWNFYLVFIAILIPIQYFMVIGLPPSLCMLFPWNKDYWSYENISKAEIYRRLQDWAFLLDNEYPPVAKKLICDFILLMFVSRQSVVFRIEKRFNNQEYSGGSNNSIIHLAEEKNFINPVPDYITYVRSYLDVIKRGIFLSFFWITMALVFLAGTNRVNIFSIGYLGGAFIFLWQGSDLYLRPIPKILRSWNWLLGYNVIVILIKVSLQSVGCVFIQKLPKYSCWAVQLFAIGCVKKFGNIVTKAGLEEQPEEECTVPREFVGLVWDGLSFGFLILMRRIFQSYNFFHIIDETKATTILASRGAELIEELRQKRIRQQEESEKKVLEKIKLKMDRIKASQQRIQGASYQDTTNHFIDTIFKGRPKYRRKQPKTYKEAIRSGDYYMFEELDDDGLDLIEEPAREEDDEAKVKGVTVGKFLSTALKTDMTRTVRLHRSHSELNFKRRSSPHLNRQRSAVSDFSQLSIPYSASPTVEDRVSKFVKIHDEKEPKPSTSHDKSESSDDDQPEITKSFCEKVQTFIEFIWVFIKSIMISITNFLNRYSKDYRYIMRVLTKEKRFLKETTAYTIGVRVGAAQKWQPAGSHHDLLKHPTKESLETETDKKVTISDESDTKALATSLPSEIDSEDEIQSTYSQEYERTELSSVDQPVVIRLLLAFWHIIMCRSELLCYFIIFLNQVKSATFLSLPLPLMVLLWGTLTLPRPSKTFWVTIIAYTEIIVMIKCMFQFDIIPWNMNQRIINNPFSAPRIIGIERSKNFAVWDLLLLLVVFFHRFMLKSLGLWRVSVPLSSHLLRDGDYKMNLEGDLQPLSDSSKYKEKSDNDNEEGLSGQSSDLIKLVDETDLINNIDEFSDKIVNVHTETVDAAEIFPQNLKIGTVKYTESLRKFFVQLLDPISRVADDVYSYMFLCDFFNFFVILIGYSSFGVQQGDGGVSSYLEDNRVPVLFLVMLILQFMLIIVDRGIFLRKNILAKLIFQFIQVILLHIWLFIIFPIITERRFNSVLPPQMYYMVKCFYLLLSAYQIRCGYPTRILGNFLCKGYTYLNMFLFKGFMLIPFLFELRTVMDWMWTDTSMTVFDWIKMEDIFAHIFQLKCSRHVETEYPQERGTKKNPIIKYLSGGGILIIIIGFIWFPLVFFSFGNAVGKTNPPYDVTVTLRIGPYEPVYQMSAGSNSIYTFTLNDMNQLLQIYNQHKTAVTFISNYEAGDVAAAKLSLDSANIWTISPPDRERMINEVNSSKPLAVRLDYKITHKTSKSEDSGVIPLNVEITLPATIDNKLNIVRQNLLEMLLGTNSESTEVILDYIFPKFIKVTNRGTVKIINNFMEPDPTNQAASYRNISLILNRSNNTANGLDQQWWKIHENCDDYNYKKYLKKLPYGKNCDSILLYTFNDRIFPSSLNVITGGGIIGLYTTLVFVASRILRGFFAEQCFKIIFEDMPNVDRVLQLCLDIYLVRESGEFALEEDLFAKLVFLFRSPETLIKWTRPKEELSDDDDPEGDAS